MTDIYAFYEVNHCDTLVHYTMNDIHPSNSLQGIKQNPWAAKYRSLTYIYFRQSIFVLHWYIIPTMTFFHQIVLKILSKITGPQNIGHWPTYILWVQSSCHRSIIISMTFPHQKVFKILSEVNGPQNIGQWPTYILYGQPLCHTDPLYQVWHASIK